MSRYIEFPDGVDGTLLVEVDEEEALVEAVSALPDAPETVEISFALKATGEVGNIATAKIGGQANFAAGGRYLVTSDGSDVLVWTLTRDDLIAAACRRLTRNLTPEEWREYVGDQPYRKSCPGLE
jgi:hypothetical protein